MEQNQETDQIVSQMRKSVQNLGSSTEKYGDATLKRFLIARSMDPNKAAKMFVQWQKWRDSFVPLGFIPDSEVTDELESRKMYLQGLSKQGHPVLLVKACKHFPSKDQPQFKMPSKVEKKGNEKLIAILDLQQLGYKNVDIRGFITGFQFLQAYYPERLARLYILNMPWFFVSIWRTISSFLEKATIEKIVIVGNEGEKREVLKEVGEEALPEEYCGKAKLILLQDVALSDSLEE